MSCLFVLLKNFFGNGTPIAGFRMMCPLEELKRREKERGNRAAGIGEYQLSWLNPQDTYDITVDTFNNSTEMRD